MGRRFQVRIAAASSKPNRAKWHLRVRIGAGWPGAQKSVHEARRLVTANALAPSKAITMLDGLCSAQGGFNALARACSMVKARRATLSKISSSQASCAAKVHSVDHGLRGRVQCGLVAKPVTAARPM